MRHSVSFVLVFSLFFGFWSLTRPCQVLGEPAIVLAGMTAEEYRKYKEDKKKREEEAKQAEESKKKVVTSEDGEEPPDADEPDESSEKKDPKEDSGSDDSKGKTKGEGTGEGSEAPEGGEKVKNSSSSCEPPQTPSTVTAPDKPSSGSKIFYNCPKCGYVTDSAGNCPTCNVPLGKL